MCIKEAPPGFQRPARRTRTKTRRPKFLSLRLRLSPEEEASGHRRQNQLNLFPVHPDIHDDTNVAQFFHSDAETTLSSLLAGSESSDHCATTVEVPQLSPSLTYAFGGSAQDREEGEDDLMRAAMRRRSEETEERWVSYSEVVEKKEEEVTSCSAGPQCYHDHDEGQQHRRLSLKLDYDEIMNAWSNKGPFYVVKSEDPQIVPDMDSFLWHDLAADGWMECWGSNTGKEALWSVPQTNEGSLRRMREEEPNVQEESMSKKGRREASVLRYKEKRQNRLFSKRIRYEVRKLNAEKRPRIKGRFVRRS